VSAYTLDACSLIAYFRGEQGQASVQALLESAEHGDCSISMHIINLLEIYYDFYRSDGKAVADSILKDAHTLRVAYESNISDAVFHEAGRIKANYSLSLADAIAVSYASSSGAELVSADHHELEPLEAAGEVKMYWFR
jgi:predicted nucleic acid-binding protein